MPKYIAPPASDEAALDHILAVGQDPHRTPRERLAAVLRMAAALCEQRSARTEDASASVYDLMRYGTRMRVHVEVDTPDGRTATYDLHRIEADLVDDEATMIVTSAYDFGEHRTIGDPPRISDLPQDRVRLALSGRLLGQENGEKFRMVVPTDWES